jgi:hypothetical protein
MNRAEFMGLFLGLMVKKIPMWLPEESTEEEMLDLMMKSIDDHRVLIRKILVKNGKNNNRCQ